MATTPTSEYSSSIPSSQITPTPGQPSRRRAGSAGRGKPTPLIGRNMKATRPRSYSAASITHTLVVCGTDDLRNDADAASFADFMGIAMTMRAALPDMAGSFFSCFPIEKHFDELAQKKNIHDIKWGHFGPNEDPLFTYSRTEYTTRQGKWFEEIDPDNLRFRVVKWLIDKAGEAVPGDVVNVFICSHGGEQGQMWLGTKPLTVETFIDLTRRFAPGVQLNAVGNHCRSGYLVDGVRAANQLHRYAVSACGAQDLAYSTLRSVSNRTRNMRFSQPFIQSLAKAKLPGIPQTQAGPITLEQHESFMLAETRKFSQTQGPQHYQSTFQHPVSASLILLEELVFRDMTDIVYSSTNSHRRRRTEWPTLDRGLINRLNVSPPTMNHISPRLATNVSELIIRASASCDADRPYHDDGRVFNLLGDAEPIQYHGPILKILYYRGRLQSAIWDLFQTLCSRGFLDSNICLQEPMSFTTSSQPQRAVYRILSCFEAVIQDQEPETRPFEHWTRIEAPVSWLAVMIARACADPALVVAEIQTTKMLGNLDRERFKDSQRSHEPMSWTCSPTISAGISKSFFGFWLPHGLGSNVTAFPDLCRERVKFFNEVEEYYKEWFQVPDLEVCTEAQQDSFLRAHPELEPRLKFSGHWQPGDPGLSSPPLSPTNPQISSIIESHR